MRRCHFDRRSSYSYGPGKHLTSARRVGDRQRTALRRGDSVYLPQLEAELDGTEVAKHSGNHTDHAPENFLSASGLT